MLALKLLVKGHGSLVLASRFPYILCTKGRCTYQIRYIAHVFSKYKLSSGRGVQQVGHVGVTAGRLLRSEVMTMTDVKDAAAEAGAVAMTFFCAVLAELVACLSAAPPGRYLLTHAPGGGSLAVWRALPGDLAGAEVRG